MSEKELERRQEEPPFHEQVRYDVRSIVDDQERFGGGRPPVGHFRPQGAPKEDKPPLTFEENFELNPEHPLVTVKMDVMRWAEFLNQGTPRQGVTLTSDNILPAVFLQIGGDVISLAPVIRYNPPYFRLDPGFITSFSVGRLSSYNVRSISDCGDFFERKLKGELLKYNLIQYLHSDASQLFFSVDKGSNPATLQQQLQEVCRCLAIAVEIFIRAFGSSDPRSLHIPAPKEMASPEGGQARRGGISDQASVVTEEQVKALEVENVTETLDDLGGNPELRQEIEKLAKLHRQPEFFAKYGISPPRGILLYGPPGTGKTLAAKIFAGTVGRKFYHVRASDILSMFYGESEKVLRGIFEHVQPPCVVFIDEVDSIAEHRDHLSEPSRRVLTELLQQLDGMKGKDGVILLAATNRKEALDPAILRAGRLDRHIFVDRPDEVARQHIFQIHLKKERASAEESVFEEEINVLALAQASDGMVGADIAEIVRRTKERYVYQKLEQSDTPLVSLTVLHEEIEKYKRERERAQASVNREPFGFTRPQDAPGSR